MAKKTAASQSHRSPNTRSFNLRIAGDFNQDVLVPKEAHIPLSTKDPALSTASTGVGNLIRKIPGGAWTQHKMLLGLSWAWREWEEKRDDGFDPEKKAAKKTPPPDFIYEIKRQPKHVLPNYAVQPQEERNKTKASDVEDNQAELARGHYQWSDDEKGELSEIYQWVLRKFPQKRPFDEDTVIRSSEVVPMGKATVFEEINKPKKVESWRGDAGGGKGWMHVIGDYDVGFRYGHYWDREDLKQENQLAGAYPARLLMLGSHLPFKGQHRIRDKSGNEFNKAERDHDHFWGSLLYEEEGSKSWSGKPIEDGKIGTVIVVGADMLRMNGADIAFDQSWDRILEDFNREKQQCEVLQKLCEFEHLIVRIGVTGVIYHNRKRRGDAIGEVELEEEGETQLIYDPMAPRIWFRAPDDQGNILGTRSALAACIVARLARGWTGRETELGGAQDVQHMITRGAKDAVCFMQELYSGGFGDDPSNIQACTTPGYYQHVYARTVLWAGTKGLDELKAARGRSEVHAFDRMKSFRLPQRRRYIAHVSAPVDDSPNQWGIIRSSLRMNIPEKQAQPTSGEWARDVEFWADQRRLWLAMRIVMDGHESILNSHEVHYDYRNAIEKLKGFRKLKKTLKGPYAEQLNSGNHWEIPTRLTQVALYSAKAGSSGVNAEATLLLQYLALIYPFNAPVAVFGSLIAVGQRDVETYTNIRNLLTNHLRHGREGNKPLPLNIAVFGGPGSGKSFGVKKIAEELGIQKPMEFNVTQFRGKEDLDAAMLRVVDALAQRRPGDKPPLVFFDEFDCAGPDSGPEFMWLSHFLEPMQDGTYMHPSGKISLGNAIFVFAGGIHASYRAFQDRALGTGTEQDRHQARVRKFPDFVSRIRGFVDVGSLNPREQDLRYSADERDTPYLQRALTLRGMLEAEKWVDHRKRALIHEDVAEAFLTVSRFQHGKRSMESLLKSCVRIKQQIVQSSFPTQPQLDMHTWGAEFRERMHLPGSIWLTEYLYIPSQPKLDDKASTWTVVGQWDLLDDCGSYQGAEKWMQVCAALLLERIFDKDSEVWIRRKNIIDAAKKLETWLHSTFDDGSPGSTRGWYRPDELYEQTNAARNTIKPACPVDKLMFDGMAKLNGFDGNEFGKGHHLVIPLVMLQEVRPIHLRLHWKGGRMALESSSIRLAAEVERDPHTKKPHAKALWTREWGWKKIDKVRILRHILKNFFVAVHGEKEWRDFESRQKTNSIPRKKLSVCVSDEVVVSVKKSNLQAASPRLQKGPSIKDDGAQVSSKSKGMRRKGLGNNP